LKGTVIEGCVEYASGCLVVEKAEEVTL